MNRETQGESPTIAAETEPTSPLILGPRQTEEDLIEDVNEVLKAIEKSPTYDSDKGDPGFDPYRTYHNHISRVYVKECHPYDFTDEVHVALIRSMYEGTGEWLEPDVEQLKLEIMEIRFNVDESHVIIKWTDGEVEGRTYEERRTPLDRWIYDDRRNRWHMEPEVITNSRCDAEPITR